MTTRKITGYKVWVEVEAINDLGDGENIALPDPLFWTKNEADAIRFTRELPGFPNVANPSDLGPPLEGWAHHLRAMVDDLNDELDGLDCLARTGEPCDHVPGADDLEEIDADPKRFFCAVCAHGLTVARAGAFLDRHGER